MKKILLAFIAHTTYLYWLKAFAADDAWILWWGWLWAWDSEICVTAQDLRTGELDLEDIPCILRWMIDIFMGFAASIAVIFVIIWAYQIIIGSVSGDKSKWKSTIIMALVWFALAAFSWFIVRLIIDNFA